MALTDKNILITPNIGAASDPKLVFSGADAATAAQNITLTVYPTNGGTLSFDGSTGQLFSVTNSMSGTIFSANDVSGIPSIEVLDTGLVKIAQYSGNVLLGTGTDSGLAKLQVTGAISATGNIVQNTGSYVYPGSSSGLTNNQTNYYLSSHNSWGIYTNTSFNAQGGVYDIGSRVLSTATYNSYSPTLTGGSASGTWGISVTGSAGSVTGLTLNKIGNGINPDNVVQNQIGYNTSVSLFGQTDGGLYSSAHDASWIHQIYGDFRTGQIAIRGKNNTTWQAWRAVLDASNYTSYSPTLTGGSASGTWGISVTGSAGSLSLSNGFTLTAGASGYGQFSNWIYLPGAHGFYSGVNSAHFYPNDVSSYGAWHISGPRNGWNGLSFAADNGAVQLMVAPSSNETGFHANNYGWQFRWTSGTLYCHKNTYGGGTAATVLDSSNYTSYAAGLSSSNTFSGINYFTANQDTGSGSNPPLQAYGTNSGAMMSFHRGGYYAVNMGLDSDNVIRIGGWSASANRLQMDMSGNLTMAGNVTAYSDERLKKDWELLPTDFVKNLALVKVGTFTRIDSNERQVGVSAQSLTTFLPEAVQDDGEYLSVAYGNAALASAVELAKEVVSLNQRIARLEALVSKLIEG